MSKKYTQLRYRHVYSYEDIKKVYEIAEKNTTILQLDHDYIHDPKKHAIKLRDFSFVVDKLRYYTITTMYCVDIDEHPEDIYDNEEYVISKTGELKYACTWIFDKTGEQNYLAEPSSVARKTYKVYKPMNIVTPETEAAERLNRLTKDIRASAAPLLGYNEKYNLTEHQAVRYDINSAYSSVLRDKIIDTYNYDLFDIVKDNQVGFMLDDELSMVDKGDYADVIFNLIDSPYKDLVEKIYAQKKIYEKGSKEYNFNKSFLNIMVGVFQNRNPFLRAYIVNSCNKRIKDLINKYGDKICMWNTDSVTCIENIPELDNQVGTEIGQFKLEYKGLLRQKNNNYQEVDSGKLVYRGFLKESLKKDFNILTDTPNYDQKECLKYILDEENYFLKLNSRYEYYELA